MYARATILDEDAFTARAVSTLSSDEVDEELADRLSGRLVEKMPGLCASSRSAVRGTAHDRGPEFNWAFATAARGCSARCSTATRWPRSTSAQPARCSRQPSPRASRGCGRRWPGSMPRTSWTSPAAESRGRCDASRRRPAGARAVGVPALVLALLLLGAGVLAAPTAGAACTPPHSPLALRAARSSRVGRPRAPSRWPSSTPATATPSWARSGTRSSATCACGAWASAARRDRRCGDAWRPRFRRASPPGCSRAPVHALANERLRGPVALSLLPLAVVVLVGAGARGRPPRGVSRGRPAVPRRASVGAPGSALKPQPRRLRAFPQMRILAALIAALAAAGAVGTSGEPARAARSKPNVVVIMTDDQTYDDMAAMPQTRRLIGEAGATFTRTYVTYPLCCPSRATYLTGQYAHNNGVYSTRPAARRRRGASTPRTRCRCGCSAAGYDTSTSASTSTATGCAAARRPARAGPTGTARSTRARTRCTATRCTRTASSTPTATSTTRTPRSTRPTCCARRPSTSIERTRARRRRSSSR